MTKTEFLKELKITLSNELSPAEVEENMRYYTSYIDEQLRMGVSETQIFAELGDPRSIAHNIIDGIEASRDRNDYQSNYATETYYEDGVSETQVRKRHKIKSYALLVGILVLLCVILVFITKLIMLVLPMLIGIAVIVWLLKKIDGR